MEKGQFTLHRCDRVEAETLANVFCLEVRIFGENVSICQAACQ
jgi:hypothetical protein